MSTETKNFKLHVENLNDLPKSKVSIKIGYDTPITYSVTFNQMYKLIASGHLNYEDCKINPYYYRLDNALEADKFRIIYKKMLSHIVYCLKTRINSKLIRFCILASIYGNTSLRLMFGSDKRINDYVKQIKLY